MEEKIDLRAAAAHFPNLGAELGFFTKAPKLVPEAVGLWAKVTRAVLYRTVVSTRTASSRGACGFSPIQPSFGLHWTGPLCCCDAITHVPRRQTSGWPELVASDPGYLPSVCSQLPTLCLRCSLCIFAFVPVDLLPRMHLTNLPQLLTCLIPKATLIGCAN